MTLQKDSLLSLSCTHKNQLGIDWGFGSSKTAFVVIDFVDGGYC
jgi:hypothetical protein